MSELHKFIFEGLPVRGMLVRLTGAWQEILTRRQAAGGYPPEVFNLLGEMVAAACLMQSGTKFEGMLSIQILGDGPVKLAVAEVDDELRVRATATVAGSIAPCDNLAQLVNVNNHGRCAITLNPANPRPGQQPYQGVVPLFGDQHEKLEQLSQVLEHYMLQSEQLDTKLVLAANESVAAGLLIQRLPIEGVGNLQGSADEDDIGLNEDYNRIAILASSLKSQELLELDADTVLHRLFWEEPITRFVPATPSFFCSCSRERVMNMLRGLGEQEVQATLQEQGNIDVGCQFCGAKYVFDSIDAMQVFTDESTQLPPAAGLQ